MEPEAQLATVSTSCYDPSSSAFSRVDPTPDLLTSFYLVESSELSFSSRAWALFPLTALTTLGACPGPLGAEPGWVASSTGTFKAPL